MATMSPPANFVSLPIARKRALTAFYLSKCIKYEVIDIKGILFYRSIAHGLSSDMSGMAIVGDFILLCQIQISKNVDISPTFICLEHR